MKKIYNIDHNSIINLLSIDKKDNKVFYHFEVTGKVKKYFTDSELWIEYPFPVKDIPEQILAVPFVASTMSLAWITGSIVHVPFIDETFYHSFSGVRQKFQEMYPTLLMGGSIYPDEIVPYTSPDINRYEACMFSGGMDAITTFIRHKDSIKFLVYTNGLISTPETDDPVYKHETRVISDFASRYDVMPMFVKSNFYSFIKQSSISKDFNKHFSGFWHDLYHSMAFLGMSSVICFNYNITKVYIGSSNTITPWHPCASDPTTDTAVKFMNTRVLHDAFGLTRQDKTHIIVEEKRLMNSAYPLHVCSFNDHNCCKCEKCLRTMWGLIAENEDPRDYGFQVDGNLANFISSSVSQNIALMGFDLEKQIYWPHIISRMKLNYPLMNSELKDCVDWFLSYDFEKAKKDGVRSYYRKNFWGILKRKIWR